MSLKLILVCLPIDPFLAVCQCAQNHATIRIDRTKKGLLTLDNRATLNAYLFFHSIYFQCLVVKLALVVTLVSVKKFGLGAWLNFGERPKVGVVDLSD